MAQEKRTPGKWIQDGIYIDAEDGSLICTIHSEDSIENEANRKIIAAAPKMLASIERFASLNEDEYPEMKGWILEAREIHKKATKH